MPQLEPHEWLALYVMLFLVPLVAVLLRHGRHPRGLPAPYDESDAQTLVELYYAGALKASDLVSAAHQGNPAAREALRRVSHDLARR